MTPVAIHTMKTSFQGVTDFRREHLKRHVLLDLLVIALCANIGGADDWVGVENFGLAKRDWFAEFLELPNGIPSHDTFGRVFARLDPDEFQACFRTWIGLMSQHSGGQLKAIDGKTLRGSRESEMEKNPLHLVSLWVAENRLVLGQVAVGEKSNEITAIPTILRLIDITGDTITIDAMGCQTDIAELIRERQGNYVLTVKQNHPHLYEDIVANFEQLLGAGGEDCDFHETTERNRGRVEERRCWTTANLTGIRQKEAWKGLTSVAKLESKRQEPGKEATTETRYFITSLPSHAREISRAIRTHWGIENSVHWELDVVFGEDASRVRTGHAPENFAFLRRMALNLLQHETSFKASIKAKRQRAGWNEAYLVKVLDSALS